MDDRGHRPRLQKKSIRREVIMHRSFAILACLAFVGRAAALPAPMSEAELDKAILREAAAGN